MVIEIRGDNQVALLDADEFGRLSVRLADDTGTDDRRRLLAQVGVVSDDNHVFVDPELLKSLAGARATDEPWQAAFAGMVRYARDKGWTDAAGNLQVHVEPAAGII